MPRVHKAVFSEELTAGPFQGITVIVEVVLKSRPLLTHFLKKKLFKIKLYSCFHQTHKTPKSKGELPLLPGGASLKLESSDGDEWMRKDKEEKVKPEKMKTPSGWRCSSCNTRYTDREDYITHMGELHGKVWKPQKSQHRVLINMQMSSFIITSEMVTDSTSVKHL